MLHAIAQSQTGEHGRTFLNSQSMLNGHCSDSASYGRALIEVVAIVIEVYEMQTTCYIPAGSLPLGFDRSERIRLAVVRDLISIAVHVLGHEAMSTYKLSFAELVTDNAWSETRPIPAGADEQGGTSIVGALLHKLISCPPLGLSGDDRIQEVYLDIIDQLAASLEGGSVAKRVLGNLTNVLATFRDGILPVRKRLWKTLSKYIHNRSVCEKPSHLQHLRPRHALGFGDEEVQGELLIVEQYLSNACRAAGPTVPVRKPS